MQKKILYFTLGLLMGDGSLQINHWKKKYLQYRVIIKLKNIKSNIRMLQGLRDDFNLGTININNKDVLWAINDKKQIKIFLNFFLTSKNDDLLSLSPRTKEKVNKMVYGINKNMSYSEFIFLKEKPFSEWSLRNIIIKEKLPSFNEEWCWWLSGFIEAEGCFSIRKNGNQSFSIGQKIDYIMLEYIKDFFNLTNTISSKGNDFYVIETYSIKSCLKIISFFDTYELLGAKQTSYNLWKSHINNRVNYSLKCRV